MTTRLFPIPHPLLPFPTAPITGIAVALYPSDPSYNFEIQRATSSGGAGATSIASDIPGTQQIYIDAIGLDNVPRWYRIRHMGFGDTPGAWTDWVGGTVPMVLPANVTRPAPVLPSFAETRSISGTTATVTVGVTDPQSRVSLVDFQTTNGTGAPGGWVTVSSPYTRTVTINPPESVIEYRITAYDMNGVSQIVKQKAVSFIPGQNILGIKAAVVSGTISTTAFQVDITVSDPSATAATMTLSHAEQGCTVARTGGGSDPLTTSGGTFRYTVTRSTTVDAGSGGVTFNVTAANRNDANVFVPADAQDQDAAPTLSVTVDASGNAIAVATGNNNTASWRWSANTSSMPSDGTVTGSGTVVNGRVATVTVLTGVTIGQHVYVKFAPYSGASAGGTVGQIVSVEGDRQNKTTAKTLRIPHTLFAARNQADPTSRGAYELTLSSKTSVIAYGALIVPTGASVTAWRMRAARVNGNGSVTASLDKLDGSGGTSNLGSLSHSGSGYQTSSGSLSETTDGSIYMVTCTIDTTAATNANDNGLLYIEFDYSATNLDTSI
jgi:hypothetical protein